MTFSTLHIALTAAITGLLVLAAAAWRQPRGQWRALLAVAVLSGGAVFL